MATATDNPAIGYARAVYELALEDWQKDLATVKDTLANRPSLVTELSDNRSFDEHQKQLDGILPAGISQKTRNFFYTLLKNGDLNLVSDIANNLSHLSSKGGDLQVATVTTAVALDEAEKGQFQTKLAAKYNSNLVVNFKVDPGIIGGVVVQIGDKILDGSVSTKLNSIREGLMTG